MEVVSEEETTDENQEPPNKKVCKESEGTSKKGKLASKGKKSLKVNWLYMCKKRKGYVFISSKRKIYRVKPVLRGHLWEKEKVVLKEVQFIWNFLWRDKKKMTY